jgi:hypothetical protein
MNFITQSPGKRETERSVAVVPNHDPRLVAAAERKSAQHEGKKSGPGPGATLRAHFR